MKVNILTDKVAWFGKYSGYECLTDYLPKNVVPQLSTAKYNWLNKLRGKFFKILYNWNSRSEEVLNEINFINKIKKSKASHILYLENHYHLISQVKNFDKRVFDKKVFATIHLPFCMWSRRRLDALSNIENVILLYKEELGEFSKYIAKERIHVIRHGVDTDFFKPGDPSIIRKNKILFVGHFLRNFKMFEAVYERLTADKANNFEFHMIIPTEHRHPPILQKLGSCSNIFFHEKLSDEELLAHYQDSYLLLMPLDNSGANTGIVQALATGLPIVTTDVGGIRSYGGGEVFPLVANDDVDGMVELFYKFWNDAPFRKRMAENERNFAVAYLDWRKIASEHVNLYNKAG